MTAPLTVVADTEDGSLILFDPDDTPSVLILSDGWLYPFDTVDIAWSAWVNGSDHEFVERIMHDVESIAGTDGLALFNTDENHPLYGFGRLAHSEANAHDYDRARDALIEYKRTH